MSGATATPSGLAAVSSSLRQHGHCTRALPAWSTAVQRSGRERDSAVQQGRHGITPFGSPPFGARGFCVHQGHGPPRRQALGRVGERRGTEAQPIGFSLQPRAFVSPELFTNKKGLFRVLPFLQEGFMSVTPQNKLADRAVRVFFLNGGDNHASCTCLLYTSPSPRD